MAVIAALVAILVCFGDPPLGPLAIVLTVNLYLWRGRAAIRHERRSRSRAEAEERRRRALILAMRSLP